MSGAAPFVQQLRTGRSPVTIAGSGAPLAFRVEASDIWDAARVSAPASASVVQLKRGVVDALFPGEHVADFVMKLRGWEILDENATIGDAGIGNGSIVLIAYRRRRPVR